MNRNNLESMPVDELWTLHEKIEAALAARLATEKSVLENRLMMLNRQHQTKQLREEKSSRRPYPRVLPKYRNPAQPTETWAGRGKTPRWLTALLKSGKKLDDFLIRPANKRARRAAR
jgi:DNA-binding protein H-NS